MSENYMEDMAKEYNKMLKDVDLEKATRAISDARVNPIVDKNDLARRIRGAQGNNVLGTGIDIVEEQIAYIDNLLCMAHTRIKYKTISYLRSLKNSVLRRLKALSSNDTFVASHSEPLFCCTQTQIINTLVSLQIDLFEALDTIALTSNINEILMLENRATALIALI